MSNIIEFRTQVDYMIAADEDEMVEPARDKLIKAAVAQYSRDRPDEYVEDVTGDAGKYYDLASELSYWDEGFSRILAIEYPAATIASDETPQYLDPEDWDDDYWYDGDRYLWLPNHAPAATEAMRIRYTRPYAWSGDPLATDVPGSDFYAVCQLAAAFICRSLAAKYSRTSDSTIAADSVNHPTRATEFARQARDFERSYREHIGLMSDERETEAAGEFVDLDTVPGWPLGRRYLFHGNR